jgi:hypothetical protein
MIPKDLIIPSCLTFGLLALVVGLMSYCSYVGNDAGFTVSDVGYRDSSSYLAKAGVVEEAEFCKYQRRDEPAKLWLTASFVDGSLEHFEVLDNGASVRLDWTRSKENRRAPLDFNYPRANFENEGCYGESSSLLKFIPHSHYKPVQVSRDYATEYPYSSMKGDLLTAAKGLLQVQANHLTRYVDPLSTY